MRNLLRSTGLVFVLAALGGCGSLIVTQKSVEDLTGRGGFEWEEHSIDHYVLHVEPATAAAENLDAIGEDARQARETVLAYLEEPTYEPTVHVFAVDSRERMKDLIGRPSNATAYYSSNSLCLVWGNDLRVGATHELLHLVAMNLWGVPERWINEGAAVDCAGPWLGNDVHAMCKHLLERGELPSLKKLTNRFDGLPGIVSYTAAGSFVRYVRETHGLEAVRAMWDGGRRAIPGATGTDLATLEAQWHAVVMQADASGIEIDP